MTNMKFGLDKCAFLVLYKSRRIESENITLDKTTITQLDQENVCKYIGIELEKVEHKENEGNFEEKYLKEN